MFRTSIVEAINMRRGWGRRRRQGRRGRLPKPVNIESTGFVERLNPVPQRSPDPVYLDPAELEALRLVDLEGLSQEDAGVRLGVSRGTVWRLLQSARRKIIQVLTEARPLLISVEENT